ncbi:MAG: uroporphyrinogen decarboxylase [Sphingobacteriales bacterium]|nr:uroporphyrinogen decarboxylase [Sphingobacteriales bacterium]
MLKNDLLLRTLRGEPCERVPVWLMRQAGRVLPQYRALRQSLSGFKELLTTPDLACEVTVQPVDELGVDAAIIFSDILVIPEAMGLPYEMVESRGPKFPRTIATAADLATLHIAEADAVDYTLEAIRLTKRALNGSVPLLGFCGAPFTIYCYMVEGSGSKTFSKAKALLYREPQTAQRLLQMITDSSINYLKAQVAAGADAVQIFDSWAGVASPELYETFSMPYLRQIAAALAPLAPVILFSKDAHFARRSLAQTAAAAIGMDWTMDIAETRRLVGDRVVLQGNLDPCALYAPLDEVQKMTRQMLQSYGGTRHIANLGHGLYPDIPLDAVKCFVDTVQQTTF